MEKTKQIILVDVSIKIETIKEFLIKNLNIKIISFDYESHEILKKEGILHDISENFLQENNFDYIQKQVYEKVKWYNETVAEKYLIYEGINLGKLVHSEIHIFLVSLFKKFHEILNIYKTYPDHFFITSYQLHKLISMLTKSTLKINSFDKTPKVGEDAYMKIGGKHSNIFIGRLFYQKIKKILDIFSHVNFNASKKIINNQHSTLFVEFDPLRFNRFILESKKFHSHKIFFGRRRPPILSLKTFLLFKKTKSKIITPFSLKNRKFFRDKNQILEIKNKIETLWTQEAFFNSFFSIDKISIWTLIKPYFIESLENRLNDILYEIEFVKHMFQEYKFNKILLFSEIGFSEQIIVHFAKKSNIPTLLLQHGCYYETAQKGLVTDSQGVFPSNSDKFLVWGNSTKQNAISYGIVPEEKIETLGCIRFDNLQLENSSNNDYVLFAITGPEPEFVHGLSTKNIEEYMNTIRKICEIVNQMGKKLVIKLHPSPDALNVKDIVHKIDSKITVVTSGDVGTLIPACSVLIVLELTTSIIEAQLHHKPVVFVETINYDSLLGRPEVLTSKSVEITLISELENTLKKLFNNDEFRKKSIQKYQNFIVNYITNIGNACNKTWSFITKT